MKNRLLPFLCPCFPAPGLFSVNLLPAENAADAFPTVNNNITAALVDSTDVQTVQRAVALFQEGIQRGNDNLLVHTPGKPAKRIISIARKILAYPGRTVFTLVPFPFTMTNQTPGSNALLGLGGMKDNYLGLLRTKRC